LLSNHGVRAAELLARPLDREEPLDRPLFRIASTREGVVELMCHPGYTPSTVSSGYGAQREVELATFVSAAAREALVARGLTLSSWSGV
jgi:predicted glycoside hydrolase/deacetylase ChbG (UPF0249 family)